MDRAVVITGASSGIGMACSLVLKEKGFQVFGSVRNQQDTDTLKRLGIHPLLFDVTSRTSIEEAVEIVSSLTNGKLWGLVNNAGICESMPLECIPIERFQKQLEVNLTGQLSTIQAFLPLIRKTHGRILVVGSGLGRVAMPYMGPYVASEFGKVGLVDALRRELRPFHIPVTLIEPGAVKTAIWNKMIENAKVNAENSMGMASYRTSFLRFVSRNEKRSQLYSVKPTQVAHLVFKALSTRYPKPVYRIGLDSHLAGLAGRFIPEYILDALFTLADT